VTPHLERQHVVGGEEEQHVEVRDSGQELARGKLLHVLDQGIEVLQGEGCNIYMYIEIIIK